MVLTLVLSKQKKTIELEGWRMVNPRRRDVRFKSETETPRRKKANEKRDSETKLTKGELPRLGHFFRDF
jgi:hypothetical protein